VFPFLGAIEQANEALVMVFGVLLAGFIYSMPNAVWPATYAEYFPTRVRLSGMAIGTQFGFALAGFTPVIAGALLGGDPANWYLVAAFTAGACAVSAIAVLTGPGGTHRVHTSVLGSRVGSPTPVSGAQSV
jgi:MFS family permease